MPVASKVVGIELVSSGASQQSRYSPDFLLKFLSNNKSLHVDMSDPYGIRPKLLRGIPYKRYTSIPMVSALLFSLYYWGPVGAQIGASIARRGEFNGNPFNFLFLVNRALRKISVLFLIVFRGENAKHRSIGYRWD